MKDWTGNKNSVYKAIAATNHADGEREMHDYYATDPQAVVLLLEQETFSPVIWEPACGEGHISKVLEGSGYEVHSTDIVYRGYGEKETLDFLAANNTLPFPGDIITNPPYKYALEFVQRALSLVGVGHKVAMFLKLTFLEGKGRKEFFNANPPKTIYVFSGRVKCAKNGDFEAIGSSAVAYAWFVWEKGFYENPMIKWIG